MLCISGAFEGEVHLIFFRADRTMQLHDRAAVSASELLTVDVLLFGKMIILTSVFLLTLFGWVPGVIGALVILNKQ